LDNRSVELVREVLLEYDEITSVNIEKSDTVSFFLKGSEYTLLFLNDDSFPTIYAVNNDQYYPHFSLRSCTIEGKRYRSICLFENDTYIEFIHTPEERIRKCIKRLIELTALSHEEVVLEYQKEFLVYWGNACSSNFKYADYKYQLFLDNTCYHGWLEQQKYPNDVIRITKHDRFFNDSNKCISVTNTPVLFLPLVYTKDIIPPLPDKPWTAMQINRLINSVDYQYISPEAYQEIKATSYSKKEIVLVFKLNDIVFSCVVIFKNAGTAKLNNKIESQIQEVVPIVTKRCDFKYLNEQIGNEVSEKHIAIVGAGSLGSYVISELIYAGFRKCSLIDDDKYQYENTFRHRIRFFLNNVSKVDLLQIDLQSIHPEIEIMAKNDELTDSNLESYILSTDALIFTVGNSDVQLKLNKALYKRDISIPVFYAWLESDGKTSHVASIKNYRQGCFECLFTDKDGHRINNILNITSGQPKRVIRNGCGGTRVPYGNKTLLTATATLLTALNDASNENKVFSFCNNQIIEKEFPQNKRCNCCGVRE